MKVALGIVCLNEAPWLRLHLPVMLQAGCFAGIVAVDGGSRDDSTLVVASLAGERHLPCDIQTVPWAWDFAKQQNAVIRAAEQQGYDAMLKYDPDELWFPDDLEGAIGFLLRGAKAVVFPRINFEGDRCHYAPLGNPRDLADYQTRLFVLHQGVQWRGRLHASINAFDEWKEAAGQIVRMPFAPIYHYEGLRPMSERALKWLNYQRVGEGQPALAVLPDGYPVPSATGRWTLPYHRPQPLDPEVCGLCAPYSEVRA